MASDFDIPAWSAIQSNRSGFDSEFVEAHQTGGSIKRIQKAHFFMSVAKTPDQKEAQLANIRIIKARFAQDGQTFKDCTFDNDKLEIVIQDAKYANVKPFRGMKKYDTGDIDKMEEHADNINEIPDANKPSTTTMIHEHLSQFEEEAIKKASDDTINDTVNDTVKNETEEYKRALNDYIEKKNTAEEQIEKAIPELAEKIISGAIKDDEILILDVDETPNQPVIIENTLPIIEETTEIIDEYFELTGDTIIEKVDEPEVKFEENIVIAENKSEILSSVGDIALSDPDAPSDACANILNVLNRKAKEQGEIKKE